MKCVTKEGETARRVSDLEASRLVSRGWGYISKTYYRCVTTGRPRRKGPRWCRLTLEWKDEDR